MNMLLGFGYSWLSDKADYEWFRIQVFTLSETMDPHVQSRECSMHVMLPCLHRKHNIF